MIDLKKGSKVGDLKVPTRSRAYRYVGKESWVEECTFYGIDKCDEVGEKALRELVRDNSEGKCCFYGGDWVSMSSDWRIVIQGGILSIWKKYISGEWEEFDDLFGC